MIVHGQEALEHFPFPISWLTEENGESSNKTTKKNRSHRARKGNPTHTLQDCFQRQIACSDPLTLTKIHRNVAHKKSEPFPKVVLDMLVPFEPPQYSSWLNETDSDIDLDFDLE